MPPLMSDGVPSAFSGPSGRVVSMKYIASVFIVATIMAASTIVRADESSTGYQPSSAAMTVMQQTHAKMQQLHAQARLSLLNSLTPAHRALLANVVGQLAISASPDAAAAARELDASLSPGERNSVLNVSTSFEQQAKQLMDSARQQLQASGAAPPMGMHAMGPGMHGMTERMPSDAGTVLLGMAARTLEPPHAFGPGGPGMR